MARPLNAVLYRTLKSKFGRVRIISSGVKMSASYAVQNGHQRLVVDNGGEYYAVNCPECGDRKHRLYFNHRYGVKDRSGTYNKWLMVCYNENCYDTPFARNEMFQQLFAATAGKIAKAKLLPGEESPASFSQKDWPGYCVPLTDLPEDHAANIWLRYDRNYDPKVLSDFYKVRYCLNSHLYLARNSLVVPVIRDKVIVGFQTRLPKDMDWKAEGAPPKWWTVTGTPRAQTFYNYDNAKNYKTGIIVEGPADVWGLGPMCYALMGSSVTGPQQKLFIENHCHHSGVLLVDPEALESKQTAKNLRHAVKVIRPKLKHGFAVVKLPAGEDPGSLDREFCRRYVTQEAKKQGVKVWWGRK